MYVPTMQGRSARELGSPDFRHPLRTAERFNEHIDDFPLAVILLSLKALSLSPSLWNTYGASDRLLFSATDYHDLSSCAVLQAFPPLFTDSELTRLYALFLLAHSEEGLSNVSFRLLNLKYPELVDEEVLSTKVTDEDLAEGVKDEYGVIYSKDGKRLLKGNKTLTEYTVRKGTRVICDSAFEYCKSLSSLTLPSSLQSIGDRAFYGCSSLTSLTLPSSLQSIGDRVFLGCTSLSSLTLPSSLQSIGDSAFGGCESLEDITLPKGLQYIGFAAFALCPSLKKIILPEELQTIRGGAFSACSSLTSVICNSFYMVTENMLLTSDGTKVISCWGKNRHQTIPNGVQCIDDYAFGGCSFLAQITLPKGLQTIGEKAFVRCSALTSLTLPSSLQSIGDRAFRGCSSLTSLTLPSSLQSIGGGAFTGCTSLRSVICNQFYRVIGQMLLSSDGTQVIAYWGENSEVTIPEGVQSIGYSAFFRCKSLSSLTLPSSLQSIGDSAFGWCSSLTSLTLPSSLQSIGEEAFDYCKSLSTLYIPAGTEAHFKSILHAEYHKYLKPVN